MASAPRRAAERPSWRPSFPSNAPGPYSVRLTTLYLLLVRARALSKQRSPERNADTMPLSSVLFLRLFQVVDAAINATADATDRRYTQMDTILVLIAQLAFWRARLRILV